MIMEKMIVKLDRAEIEKAIREGDNCQGRRWLTVSPAGEWAVHWADTNRQWNPWGAEDFVIGIPALFPEGEGAETKLAQDYLLDRLGKVEARRVEDQVYEDDGSLVEYADEHFGDWMSAARDNGVEWLLDAFLTACNGDGSDLDDPAPWGFVSSEGQVEVEPPFEFEYGQVKNINMSNENKVQAVANGARIIGRWSVWDTACLTQFALDNPDHPVNGRLDIEHIQGKVFDETFPGGRATSANYRYPTVGTIVHLDGVKLP